MPLCAELVDSIADPLDRVADRDHEARPQPATTSATSPTATARLARAGGAAEAREAALERAPPAAPSASATIDGHRGGHAGAVHLVGERPAAGRRRRRRV